MPLFSLNLVLCGLLAGADTTAPAEPAVGTPPLCVSGIYPHLAVFSTNGEIGIGAVVPWAGRLWTITYPPHQTTGGSDKLYAIGPDLQLTVRPESVGGTHACRLIHRESNQLIIGPYFISADGKVRACDLHKLVGRMTAVTRHLTDPANKVYFYDMEGAVYEVDVHSLAVTRLFTKPVPGWHGKGGYVGQGRLVISNNGEVAAGTEPKRFEAVLPPKSAEDAGVLAEWDGTTWTIVARRQFTDITGPGGIDGAPDAQSPLWALGWDKRSALLKLRDQGTWSTFRLPKGSHAMDPKHGWYTEWPRIREVGEGHWLLDMAHEFYAFPPGFRTGQTGGIRPIATHLRYIPDFCDWNGRLVLAADDCSIMQNPMAGTSQSNLWFGSRDDLPGFGPRSGWGGPWQHDAVQAGQPSEPFLVNGFAQATLHLSHDAGQAVTFTLEADAAGNGQWQAIGSVLVPPKSYRYRVFEQGIAATWVRLRADHDCTATAYFHLASPRDSQRDRPGLFAGLAKPGEPVVNGLLRPASTDHSLLYAPHGGGYYAVDEKLALSVPVEDKSARVRELCALQPELEFDAASAILQQGGQRYRLPRGGDGYDHLALRCIRECVSERYLVNVAGTFYEMPRDHGLPLLKPVATHRRLIGDFCSWRGLLVLSGVRAGAPPDGHVAAAADGKASLWFGSIDDLWQLGKPTGKGGPCLDTLLQAGTPSDPYLMTGFDRKRLALSHDGAEDVAITVQVDFDHTGWVDYQTFRVPAGQTVSHDFASGFGAHWLRIVTGRACRATAQLDYE